ncbi:MAG: tetratricopeptide repeat protein [Candidatus Midichloria sp.]|nr:tetratricopeptide repeat protein [Candidatus Midichloria sp.]
MALLYEEQYNYAKRLPFFHKALTLYIDLFGEESEEAAYVYSSMSGLHYTQGNCIESLALYRKSIAIKNPPFRRKKRRNNGNICRYGKVV